MKTLILSIIMVVMSVSAQARYDGCIREGMVTPEFINMSDEEFAVACKKMTTRDRTHSHICFTDGYAPADSAFSLRPEGKRFRNMNYKEIFEYVTTRLTKREISDLSDKESDDYMRAISYGRSIDFNECIDREEAKKQTERQKRHAALLKAKREKQAKAMAAKKVASQTNGEVFSTGELLFYAVVLIYLISVGVRIRIPTSTSRK